MKKNLSILIFFCVWLISCKSNDDKLLRFAYQEKYLFNENDKNVSLNKNIIDEYEKFNGLDQFNIPLNKYVYNPEYKIFIGVAINNSSSEIVKAFKSDTSLKILEEKNYKNNLNIFCKKDDNFAIKYIFSESKNKLPVVFNVISKDSLTIRNLYAENKIIKNLQ